MSGYKDLEIYKMAFELALKVHRISLLLPNFEKYEQGSQIRRSSKSIKDQIAEGYGRRRYKADFFKFLIYAQASCDECTSQLETLESLYADITDWKLIIEEYMTLGKKINNFNKYVEESWRS